VGAYTSAGSGAADPEALHVVWLGGNDVLFEVILGGSGSGAMQAAAGRIGAGIESLAAAGARHLLVANAPDVGRVYGNPILNPPFAQTSTPFGEADRSQSRAFPIACLADPACAADPEGPIADGFLIFDSVHPTTAVHRVIADGALAAVVPEPSTAACLALGLALLALCRRAGA
jgi:outer membrane lipase/esterase